MAHVDVRHDPTLEPGDAPANHRGSDPELASGPGRTRRWRRRWPEWAPYAAVLWSFGIAGLALVWVLGGNGYPLGANASHDSESAFGSIPVEVGSWGLLGAAVAAGLLSLTAARGRFVGRWNIAGVASLGVLAAILLLLVPDSQLLVLLGYTPIFLVGAPFGWPPVSYFDQVTWTVVFQSLAVVGGLLLAATAVAWRRRARLACTACGRADVSVRWTTPEAAASWGRWATVVAVIVPAMYAIDRLAWVVGIPLGISSELLDEMRASDMIGAAFGLGTFAAVGAVLTLGLVQRWGETFPRWMIGLAGKRVPPRLTEIPAMLVAILVTSANVPLLIGVGEIGDAQDGLGWIQTLLMAAFPVWGLALGAATLAYHLRRRGSCQTCHRA